MTVEYATQVGKESATRWPCIHCLPVAHSPYVTLTEREEGTRDNRKGQFRKYAGRCAISGKPLGGTVFVVEVTE